MILVGQKVIHKAFGEGMIINQNGNHLIISFITGDKKFSYPVFLPLKNGLKLISLNVPR